MSNSNGNSVWIKWVLGGMCSVALMFGGFIVSAMDGIRQDVKSHLQDPSIHHAGFSRLEGKIDTLLVQLKLMKESLDRLQDKIDKAR